MLSELLFESITIDTSEEALSNMKFLGRGETRTVYEYGNNKVLKVATNVEGIAANLKEIQTYKCLTKKYAAEIFDYDNNSEYGPGWIIMEKAATDETLLSAALLTKIPAISQLKQSQYFSNYTEFVFHIFSEALSSAKQGTYYNKYDEDLNLILKNMNKKWTVGLVSKISNCDIEPEDFHSKNWGIRESTGELVLIDYGFSIDLG